MAQWLRRVSQGHEMYYIGFGGHGSKPCWVELGVYSTFNLSKAYLNENNADEYIVDLLILVIH